MDFLSRLDQSTETIDFNSGGGGNRSPPANNHTALVNIHKRERTSPLFAGHNADGSSTSSASQQMLKKRRLRLVANDTATSQSVSAATQPQVTSSSLPSDRMQLLKLLKSSLAPNKYSLFVAALTAYQRESDIELLIANFVEIFDQPQFYYLFRGMRRFVKEAHKSRFDADVERLL